MFPPFSSILAFDDSDRLCEMPRDDVERGTVVLRHQLITALVDNGPLGSSHFERSNPFILLLPFQVVMVMMFRVGMNCIFSSLLR